MSFDPIDQTEIEVGKPVKKSLWQKVKDSLDDLDSRITAVDLAVSGTVPIILSIGGEYATLSTEERVHVVKTTINADITITDVTMYIDKAGASGNTQIDVLHATPGGAYVSAMTTKPILASGAGDDSTNAGAINATNEDVDDGDIITLSLTQAQAEADTVYVRIDYTFRT